MVEFKVIVCRLGSFNISLPNAGKFGDSKMFKRNKYFETQAQKK